MATAPPKLTPRLASLANVLTPCDCMADVGTDHAYLPVYACMTGRCHTAIASDLRSGPLERAQITTARFGMEARIQLRLGAGLEPLAPGEVQCIVIAGMGGPTICGILEQGTAQAAAARQILLQPMTALPELRLFLYQHGYAIGAEYLSREEEKLYHILDICKTDMPGKPPTDLELYLGARLIQNRPEHFEDYFAAQKRRLNRMIQGLCRSSAPDSREKLYHGLQLLQDMESL